MPVMFHCSDNTDRKHEKTNKYACMQMYGGGKKAQLHKNPVSLQAWTHINVNYNHIN